MINDLQNGHNTNKKNYVFQMHISSKWTVFVEKENFKIMYIDHFKMEAYNERNGYGIGLFPFA